MAISKGPCFEFVINKNGALNEFVFLPGNVSKQVFSVVKDKLLWIFKNQYGISSKNYISEVSLEDGTPSVAINEKKLVGVLKILLNDGKFKVKVTGTDRDGELKTKQLNYPLEADDSKELIPYYNKNNNDLTTRRSK